MSSNAIAMTSLVVENAATWYRLISRSFYVFINKITHFILFLQHIQYIYTDVFVDASAYLF